MTNASLHHGDTLTVPVQPFARVARSVAGYGVATALMLISPLLVFAPASLFHCAMRNGRNAAWAAGALALVLAGICVFVAPSATSAGPAQVNMAYASFLVVALSIAVPSIIAVPLVERREKFGTVVTVALFFSALGRGITELTMRAAAAFSPYAAELTEQTLFATQKAAEYRVAFAQSSLGRVCLWLLTNTPKILTATILLNIALFFILSLMMVGRLSAWRSVATTRVVDPAIRRTYLFRNLALPEWLLIAFIGGGLTPLLSGMPQRIAANALALMIFLYVLQGLAIFRFMLVKAGAGYVGGAFGFFLLGMLCMTLVGFLLLTLAGLFDPFFDFRHLKRKDDSHESHTD
ncbi:MAG: hypothetical protein NVSMB68_11550 [Thermoanaerobaculia bacterium]